MSNTNEERILKNEIWGCFKHIGIPLETLKTLPVRARRYYILMHNDEVGNLKKRREDKSHNFSYTDGDSINNFAKNKQLNEKNGVGY